MPPTIRLVSERAAEGRVREIFEEIKAGLGTSFVSSGSPSRMRPPGKPREPMRAMANFRAAAHNLNHLWQQYKVQCRDAQYVRRLTGVSHCCREAARLHRCADCRDFYGRRSLQPYQYSDARLEDDLSHGACNRGRQRLAYVGVVDCFLWGNTRWVQHWSTRYWRKRACAGRRRA